MQKEGERVSIRASMTVGLAAGLLALFLPAMVVRPAQSGEEVPLLTASPAPAAADTDGERGTADGERTVRVLLEDGTVDEQTMADYLWSVVAAEMPASFEEDALRAQAVCARTYTLWKGSGSRHSQADVCTDSSCCQAYITPEEAALRWGGEGAMYREKIARAVADTDGVVLTYGGELIQAVFFSSAAGATEDAVAVWGTALPYLVSVDSPEGEEVPNYQTEVVLSADEVRELVLGCCPEAELSGSPESWFSQPELTASGRVDRMEIGGVVLSGGEIRTMFSLRSACFGVKTEGEAVVFSVTGYGHGVGLSQYGANAMAREGADWREILRHYYTGVSLKMV